MKGNKHIFLVSALLMVSCLSLFSQNPSRAERRAARRIAADSVYVETLPDSVAMIAGAVDSSAVSDSLSLLEKSSIKYPAFSSAGDSIVEDFTNGRQMIYYYGGVTVDYDNMKLAADYMEYDMDKGEVYARGKLDTLTGEWSGEPEMTQGKTSYKMKEVRYNFNTKKAFIKNMDTREGDGTLFGENIKMLPDQTINIQNGRYTVCDAEDPHYFLHVTNAVVQTKPNNRTVIGPAWPVVEGVPLFPVVLPFGFIPKKPERATGLLMPSIGEEVTRGFYMRDAGMYFVFGDYFDFSLTGDIYTLGSWAVDINSRYKVNYKFNGSFAFTYSNDQKGERGSTDFFQSSNFSIRWQHSQDSKARPGTSFSASVNFSSPSNSRFNSHSVTEALQNQISSSISYSKNWNGKVNLSINALHSQNSRDSSYVFTLPNLTLSVTTFYPFKQKNRVGKEKVYERISFGYNTTLQNKIGFKASEFGQPGFLDKFQNGMTHNFSIGLPSFSLAKYINVTPSVSYGMNWFFRETSYAYNPDTDKVEAVQGKQFGTFGITQTYSGSISLSTRLYGMFNFGRSHKLQAIRHVITPSLGFNFSPELGTAANGWRTLQYTDKDGQSKEYSYNRFSGQLYGVPGKGQNMMASFSVGNNFEAKVRDLSDTTGNATKKIKLLDQLNLSGTYNFLADSMRLSNIGVTMSTTIFQKLSFSANANLDPYAMDSDGKRYAKLNVIETGKLFRVNTVSASLSYSISGSGKGKGNDGANGQETGSGAASYYQRNYYHPVTGEYIPGGWLYYMNPNVPWSVNFNYTFNLRRDFRKNEEGDLKPYNTFMRTLGVSGNIKLTPRMSINATSGFDFVAMKLSTTSISASYDLHCFNIQVSWVPTGQWQSYSFCIAANAAQLADLLRFKKSTSFWDN